MKYIETHAHYYDEAYGNELDEVLKKVKEAGITKIVNIGADYETSKKVIELSNKYENMYATIGCHPHDVNSFKIEEIEQLYLDNKDSGKIVGIGEIGLDYAFVNDNKELQKQVFIAQINLAKKYNLPIVVHSRDASLDTYNVIKENVPKGYKLLIHCFAPTDDLVRLVIENGYTVAFGGNITYKRNKSFGEYINKIPLTQIVLETDSPYLSPEPFRGTRNDSSRIPVINSKLAEFRNISEEECSKVVYDNSIKFYNI